MPLNVASTLRDWVAGIRGNPFWTYFPRYRMRYLVGFVSLLVSDGVNVALPLVIRNGIDSVSGKMVTGVITAGVLYFLLMAIQAVGRYLWRVYLIGTSHYIAQELRLNVYSHLQKLPYEAYQKMPTGDLMSRMTNDIESIRMAVGPGILVSIDALCVFIMILPVMFWLSVKMTLLALAFFPLVPWITTKLGDKIDFLFEELQVKMSKMGAFVQESFGAIRLIKSLILEPRVIERFGGLSQNYLDAGIEQARYAALLTPVLSFLTALGTLLILIAGGLDVIHGVITVGTFIAFQRFVVQLSWPMEAIGWAVTMNREGLAARRRIDQVLTVPEVQEIRSPTAAKHSSGNLLEISHLTYRHPPRNPNDKGDLALDLSGLAIRPGQKVGLVGGVGSGKSTFFHLLLRILEPPIGSVFLEGEDITSISATDLRRKATCVEQPIVLLRESIDDNIGLGCEPKPSKTAIRNVAGVACVSDEILQLERGFSSVLGERGVDLSGGQKQRIALARALVRNPHLLLLDDCFSAVDVEIEQKIIENFFAEYPNLSVCFATHRLSVMPRMDEIWVMEKGSVVDKGTHHELLKVSALYQQLWQKSSELAATESLEIGVGGQPAL